MCACCVCHGSCRSFGRDLWHIPTSIPRRFFVGWPLAGSSKELATATSRACTLAPVESTTGCISETLVLVKAHIGVIYPFILALGNTWQPTNPLRHVEFITPKKSIDPRVRASPSHTFASSLKSIELRATSKGTPCNIEQCGWHADLI